MKRNFKQIISACLIGLLVTQSTYGVLPALADVADTSSTIVQSAARDAGGGIASWNVASASDEIQSISFDKSGYTAKIKDDLTLTGTITVNPNTHWLLASDANAFGEDEEHKDYNAYIQFLNVDSDGLADDYALTVARKGATEGTFTLKITVPDDDSLAGTTYPITISLDGRTDITATTQVTIASGEIVSPQFAFTQSDDTLEEGADAKSYQLSIGEYGGETAADIAASITYTTDVEGIVDIKGNGSLTVTVTPVSVGEVTITAASNLENASCTAELKITVTPHPNAVVALSFEKSDMELTAGKAVGTNKLIASVSNADEVAVLRSVEYISDNEDVATVEGDKEGNVTVTPVAEGSATITALSDLYREEAAFRVKVNPAYYSLTLVNCEAYDVSSGEALNPSNLKNVKAGARIYVRPVSLGDKIHTGWNRNLTSEGETWYLTMPAEDVTLEASYRDKVFQLNEESDTIVTFDLNPEKNSPESYTFRITSDYDYSLDYDATRIRAEKTEGGIVVTPLETLGSTDITISVRTDKGETKTILVTVIVEDSREEAKLDGGNSVVESNVSAEDVADPKKQEGMSAEEYAELVKQTTQKAEAAIDSIQNNTAVTAEGATSGFEKLDNQDELVAKGLIPSGVDVTIYPVQTLDRIDMDFEEFTEKDENGNDVKKHRMIVKTVVFDITPYVKPKNSNGKGRELDGIRGKFKFRIPVPVGISTSAKFAHVLHRTGDKTEDKTEDMGYPVIRTDANGYQYIEVTTGHFSKFELTFVSSKPYKSSGSGGSSGGGGGSSRTTSATGTWIRDAVGWWYKYTDNSYPYGTWANLYYSTNSYKWYHFNAQGYMETGWFTDVDGHRYYLHPVSDGTQGYMYTGWHQIDGNWYYFTETKTDANPTGSLLVNTTTPDGYAVDASGIWIQ